MKLTRANLIGAAIALGTGLVLVLGTWAARIPVSNFTTAVTMRVAKFAGLEVMRNGSEMFAINTREGYVPRRYYFTGAAAGVRPLGVYVVIAALVASLPGREWWERLVVVLSAVPIGVALMGLRLGLWVIDESDGQTTFGFLGPGIFDEMLIPAALLFLLIAWALGKILVEETVVQKAPQRRAPPPVSLPATRRR